MNDPIIVHLLKKIVENQDQQSRLLIALGNCLNALYQTAAQNQQQAANTEAWKKAHPELSAKCQEALETLGRVQANFIGEIARQAIETEDSLLDSDFALRDFIDTYGMRLGQLNGMINMLAPLGTTSK